MLGRRPERLRWPRRSMYPRERRGRCRARAELRASRPERPRGSRLPTGRRRSCRSSRRELLLGERLFLELEMKVEYLVPRHCWSGMRLEELEGQGTCLTSAEKQQRADLD